MARMDDVPWWWIAVGWGMRLGGWAAARLVGRRRPDAGYADAVRALALLPAGGEIGGTQRDGTAWYVRTPGPLGQGEPDVH